MSKVNAYSGGGAAAAAPPLTFSGCPETSEETAHLHKPTRMQLKFSKKDPKDPPPSNLENIIYQKLSTDEITIEVIETDKCFKILVGFKTPKDLEKSKSLLKTCQFLSSTKGKISSWKPEVSVVQPKKSDPVVESKLPLFDVLKLPPVSPDFSDKLEDGHPTWLRNISSAIFRISEGGIFLREKCANTKLARCYKWPFSDGAEYRIAHPDYPENVAKCIEMCKKNVERSIYYGWVLMCEVEIPVPILERRDLWCGREAA